MTAQSREILAKDEEQDQLIASVDKRLDRVEQASGKVEFSSIRGLVPIIIGILTLFGAIVSFWNDSRLSPVKLDVTANQEKNIGQDLSIANLREDVKSIFTVKESVSLQDAEIRDLQEAVNREQIQLEQLKESILIAAKDVVTPAEKDIARLNDTINKINERLDEFQQQLADTLDQGVLEERFAGVNSNNAGLQERLERDVTRLADRIKELENDRIRELEKLRDARRGDPGAIR